MTTGGNLPQLDPKLESWVIVVLKGYPVLEKLIFWGAIVAIVYFLSPFLMALAGEKTSADFQVELLWGKRLIHWPLSILIGGSGLIYGLRQRSLRRKTIELLEEQSRKFEESVDPGRTSSGLTKKGDTSPKDK